MVISFMFTNLQGIYAFILRSYFFIKPSNRRQEFLNSVQIKSLTMELLVYDIGLFLPSNLAKRLCLESKKFFSTASVLLTLQN